jgi:ABC-type nitrate/sulfonate/bicarbonate transport system substrate-binding protein
MDVSPCQKLLAVLLILVAGLSACSPPKSPSALTPVTVQLIWTHINTFGGYYTADQKGYYAAEGLAVNFREGGPKVDNLSPVVDGTAQFGDGGSDELILARAEGKPLRAVATIYQHSPVVFFTLAGSGITKPKDFSGKTIRVAPGLAPTLHAMMNHIGVSRSQYKEVVTPSEVALFVSGNPPVWSAYLNAFVTEVKLAGHKVNLIFPDNYGVHSYGNSLFARDDFIAAKPDLVKRFLRATLKGWTYIIENPTDIGVLIKKYKPDSIRERELAGMAASIPLINTGENPIGSMDSNKWLGMGKMLREQGVLNKPLDITQVYTTQFLQEIHKR